MGYPGSPWSHSESCRVQIRVTQYYLGGHPGLPHGHPWSLQGHLGSPWSHLGSAWGHPGSHGVNPGSPGISQCQIRSYLRGSRLSEREIERAKANICQREREREAVSQNCRYRSPSEAELKIQVSGAQTKNTQFL